MFKFYHIFDRYLFSSSLNDNLYLPRVEIPKSPRFPSSASLPAILFGRANCRINTRTLIIENIRDLAYFVFLWLLKSTWTNSNKTLIFYWLNYTIVCFVYQLGYKLRYIALLLQFGAHSFQFGLRHTLILPKSRERKGKVTCPPGYDLIVFCCLSVILGCSRDIINNLVTIYLCFTQLRFSWTSVI